MAAMRLLEPGIFDDLRRRPALPLALFTPDVFGRVFARKGDLLAGAPIVIDASDISLFRWKFTDELLLVMLVRL